MKSCSISICETEADGINWSHEHHSDRLINVYKAIRVLSRIPAENLIHHVCSTCRSNNTGLHYYVKLHASCVIYIAFFQGQLETGTVSQNDSFSYNNRFIQSQSLFASNSICSHTILPHYAVERLCPWRSITLKHLNIGSS